VRPFPHHSHSSSSRIRSLRARLAQAESELAYLRAAPPADLLAPTPDAGSDADVEGMSERSMDLASPLEPTCTLPLPPSPPSPASSRHSRTSSQHSGASSRHSRAYSQDSRASSPALPVFALDPDADTAELEHVRAQLLGAEARLRAKDAELGALRNALNAAATARARAA
jgi:hypothetical protein